MRPNRGGWSRAAFFERRPVDQPAILQHITNDLVDPEVRDGLALFPPIELHRDTLDAQRQLRIDMLAQIGDPPPTVEVTDHVVDADRGLIVRIHRPADVHGPLPCHYSMHGGGYVLGTRLMDDLNFRTVVPELCIAAASVEYRLAPEHPYPAALEDCYDGLAWLVDNADSLGIDTTRLGIGGVSAGGGLAAALALLVRDRAEFEIQYQLLLCPMIDDRQVTVTSQLDGLAVWSREANEFGWRAYLGELYGADDVPMYAAPSRAVDLSGLPPAFINVGTIDGFCDENIDYATRLNHAGVPTELHVYPGGPHGFQMFVDSAIAKQAMHDTRDWLRRQFARLGHG